MISQKNPSIPFDPTPNGNNFASNLTKATNLTTGKKALTGVFET